MNWSIMRLTAMDCQAGDQHLEKVIVIEMDVHSRDVSGPRMIVLQGSQQSLHVPRMMIRSFSGALQ